MAITIQDVIVTQDLFVLTMEGMNVVLGVQWLETLGTVRTNYKNLTLEFDGGEGTVRLQGDSHIADSAIANKGLRRMAACSEVAYFCHITCDPPTLSSLEVQGIQDVLDRFNDIFNEPSKLPPSRATDHRITLVAGAQLVNVNPYR